MICSKCLVDKDISNFSLRNKEKGIKHKDCKDCHSLYRKQHYLLYKDKYIAKAREWNNKQGRILSLFLFNLLSQSECIDCGEKDILVLEFDHLGNKKFNISSMYKNRYSINAVRKELEKCVVRCANCHRRKTAISLNFWKNRMNNKGA